MSKKIYSLPADHPVSKWLQLPDLLIMLQRAAPLLGRERGMSEGFGRKRRKGEEEKEGRRKSRKEEKKKRKEKEKEKEKEKKRKKKEKGKRKKKKREKGEESNQIQKMTQNITRMKEERAFLFSK